MRWRQVFEVKMEELIEAMTGEISDFKQVD
jgi:hypothetical protein